MPAKKETHIYDKDDVFRLKVGEIVYTILKERDPTFKEVDKIKEAIKSSIDLIMAQHNMECLKDREIHLQEILRRNFDETHQGMEEITSTAIINSFDIFRREELDKIIANAIDGSLNKHKLESAESMVSEMKEERIHTYKVIGMSIAIFGIILVVLQIALKLTGVM